MFRKKEKTSEPQSHIDSLIGADTQINGDLNFQGGLRIDGRVTGNVTQLGEKPSTLVLSEKAFVQGEIHVSHAVINGTVVGPIHSYESLELQAQAKVSGAVSYKNIETQVGATVEGMVRRLNNAQLDNKVVALISAGEDDHPK